MVKHSGWVVLVLEKENGFNDLAREPIVIGPVSKRKAKYSARKIRGLDLVCKDAEAVSIREYLGGRRGR